MSEFLQAAEAYAKKHRRVMAGVTVKLDQQSYRGNGLRSGIGRACVYLPFMPKWFVMEAPDGLMIADIKFGAQSQFVNSEPVPASLYSIDDALELFDSPESPAWDRFRMEPAHGGRIEPSEPLSVQLEERRPLGGMWNEVHCVFIGNEVSFRRWEASVSGRLKVVSMTAEGPMVEVTHEFGSMRVPVMPSDLPRLMDKIGARVRFVLSTEE